MTANPNVNFNLYLNVEAEGGLETFTVRDVDYIMVPFVMLSIMIRLVPWPVRFEFGKMMRGCGRKLIGLHCSPMKLGLSGLFQRLNHQLRNCRK